MTEVLGWLAPAPLWGDGGIAVESPALLQPFMAEMQSDQFVAEFLAVMSAPGTAGGPDPTDLFTMSPTVANNGSYRLYQPLSQRYYLVTASLVCRRVGIPDRAVDRSAGERTSFVVRRLMPDGTEQAWVPITGAPAIPGGPPTGTFNQASPCELFKGEEQFPMHPAPVATFAAPGTTAATFGMAPGGPGRTVHYGYIATGRRERMIVPLSDDVAVSDLATVNALAPADGGPKFPENPMLGDLFSRVVHPWRILQDIAQGVATPPGNSNTDYASLYVILDLGDWLNTNLPTVYANLMASAAIGSSAGDALRAAIEGITVKTKNPSSSTTLAQALIDLSSFEALVSGADIAGPSTDYDLTAAWTSTPDVATWLGSSRISGGGSLAALALAALNEAQVQPSVPAELQGMIKIDPAWPVAGNGPDNFIIRTVFQHDPCRPVLSAQSPPFQLARALDGDAPARKIRIALPDISNLRQFQRGVAIEMPPSLRRVLDRVTPKTLQGDLGNDPGVELGMICSFSIQIMWVLSFMVMFVFVLTFNIIFWWVAFIKICFPIPVPAPEPTNPSPNPSP